MNKLLNKITQGNLEVVAANANATLKRKESTVHITDFEIPCSIGVYEYERDMQQTIRLSIDAKVTIESFGNVITINDVANYEPFINHAMEISNRGHINLIENFADELAGKCFSDSRVEEITIKIEKTQIVANAKGTGFSATYTRA